MLKGVKEVFPLISRVHVERGVTESSKVVGLLGIYQEGLESCR